MEKRLDRSRIVITSSTELEREDRDYWAHATITEKLETITYLRECFYGKEATTGRLQRVCEILKHQ